MRSVAIVNGSTLAGTEDVERCTAALQTQVARDLEPTWGLDARLRVAEQPAADDEVLWLLDDSRQADTLGHAARLQEARPCGFIFLRPCLEVGESWQTAASHELLELLANPLQSFGAIGPTPLSRPRGAAVGEGLAYFALEICDPVAGENYDIAGVPVANFVLPSWFVSRRLPDEVLVDFLGRLAEPFTLSPGGCASYCVEPGHWQPWWARRCPRHRRQAGTYSRRRRLQSAASMAS